MVRLFADLITYTHIYNNSSYIVYTGYTGYEYQMYSAYVPMIYWADHQIIEKETNQELKENIPITFAVYEHAMNTLFLCAEEVYHFAVA